MAERPSKTELPWLRLWPLIGLIVALYLLMLLLQRSASFEEEYQGLHQLGSKASQANLVYHNPFGRMDLGKFQEVFASGKVLASAETIKSDVSDASKSDKPKYKGAKPKQKVKAEKSKEKKSSEDKSEEIDARESEQEEGARRDRSLKRRISPRLVNLPGAGVGSFQRQDSTPSPTRGPAQSPKETSEEVSPSRISDQPVVSVADSSVSTRRQLNVNSSSVTRAALMRLPGVGPVEADRYLQFRAAALTQLGDDGEVQGGTSQLPPTLELFQTKAQFMDVTGIDNERPLVERMITLGDSGQPQSRIIEYWTNRFSAPGGSFDETVYLGIDAYVPAEFEADQVPYLPGEQDIQFFEFPGAQEIAISFQYFDTEPGWDFVDFFDGFDRYLLSLSGDMGESLIPFATDFVVMEFFADEVDEPRAYYGYKIDRVEVTYDPVPQDLEVMRDIELKSNPGQASIEPLTILHPDVASIDVHFSELRLLSPTSAITVYDEHGLLVTEINTSSLQGRLDADGAFRGYILGDAVAQTLNSSSLRFEFSEEFEGVFKVDRYRILP